MGFGVLNYLLSPEFQIVNTAGKPCTGYLEVFIHGSRTRYYCASDWNGTLYPFQVPLDSLGSNVVLADDSHAYDVYIYNRYGSIIMSRYNIHPSSGGSMGGTITSTDGSVTVTPTQDGWDLSVNDNKASAVKVAADTLYADGLYSFRKKESIGDQITVQNGFITLQDGWYHFSATVKLNWTGINVNQTDQLKLYTALTYDVIDFDYSYNHVDTIMLDGDIYIAPHSTQYVSFGRNFTLAVMGMHQGLSAELVDLDIHTVTGHGYAGGGEKNVHRLLRYYTDSAEADAEHPVGDWLHDLDATDPADPSGHPMVTADQLFEWYEAGQNFELYEVDGTNGQLGWSAVYRMVTWQDQSDWWSQFAPTPGKACRLEFFRMGMYSTPYRGGLIAYIRYKDEDYMRLYDIKPGQSVWIAEYQEKLPHYASDWHAGDYLHVKQDGSDLEWVPLSGVASTGSYNDLTDKPSIPTKTSELTNDSGFITASEIPSLAQSNWAETDPNDPSYIQNKPTLAAVATSGQYSDLSGTPTIPSATSDLTNDSGFITASDVPAAQTQADWEEADSADPAFIRNKPTLATVATSGSYSDLSNTPSIPTATSDLTNDSGFITSSEAPVQDVYVDGVSVVDSQGVAQISMPVIPTIPVTDVEVNGASVVNAQGVAEVSVPAQVNSDWNAQSGVAQILNKPTLAAVATSGDYSDLSNTPSIPRVGFIDL